MKLSIVIPAYNEEKRILKTLEDYYSFFKKKLKNSFELVIIPNNCTDDTYKISQEFSKHKKNIQIFNIPYYVGKGGAVIKGFEIAKGDLIGFVDADNSTGPENFFKLYENINGFDGIIGSRKLIGSVVYPKRRLTQDLSSYMFNLLVRILFNFKFKDTQCGAKIFKKECARYLSEKISEKAWAFDVDILYLCKKKNYKILEYPIHWSDSVGSKLTLLGEIESVFKLLKYRIKN